MKNTLETKCKNKRCDYVFDATTVLYGNACMRMCPKCHRWTNQKMEPKLRAAQEPRDKPVAVACQKGTPA
jgi:hypothetical protein